MPRNVSTFPNRFLAYLDMLFVDHGLFRVIYNNLHALPGAFYRCSQPSPGQIRKYHKQLGIKTIINLRGADKTRRYALEEDVCRQLGITLINHKGVLSRSAPEVAAIRATRDLFASIEYPALMHCKSGADRAGMVSALYRHFHLGHPIAEVMEELHWYYGHLKGSKTGILDAFFVEYLNYNARHPIEFMTWVETVYDREALKANYKVRGFTDFIVDKVLDRE